MSSHLTPLDVVECLVAPITDLHDIVGCREKTPYGWRKASKYRDQGDMPPRINRRLLAYAAARGLPLTADHLISGAPRHEIEALLQRMGKPMPTHLLPIAARSNAAPLTGAAA